MTKLWILSDLHQDHGTFQLEPPPGSDIAVVAGDVVNDQFLVDLAERLPVVFVAGNHEFYGHAIGGRKAELNSLPVHFLDDSSVEIGGVLFIGSTLWTDYGRDPVAAEAARRGMNDHRKIAWTKEPWQRFLPSHATRLHEFSRNYIAGRTACPFDGSTVVVSHHAPSARSIHPRYLTGPHAAVNRAYYSDIDDIVAASGADLWVHGHVHSNFDYRIGETRVVCNPHGYPGENREFNPSLIIEV